MCVRVRKGEGAAGNESNFDLVSGYIFENLPAGVFNDIVRIFLSVELTLTFPIVFKPASDVMEEIWYNIMMVS